MALACGSWPVGKDMAKVATTTATVHFGAARKQGVVFFGANRVRQGLPKSGPPRATVKFGF